MAEMNQLFPLDVLTSTCPIDHFYRHWGIQSAV
jgi:hypothetical protein